MNTARTHLNQRIVVQQSNAGRILTLPPTGKSCGGAPASGTAFFVRVRAKAPCRRPALRWQCQDAPSSPGPAASTARGGAFTLIELLVVIGIIALLAGMIVGGTKYASTTMKRNRIQAELKQLVTAIEAYRAKFNQYPPDNFVNGIANSVTNQLFYELTGVLVDDDKKKFYLPGRQERFGSVDVQRFFHTDGFLNSGSNAKEIKQFLASKSGQHKVINVAPDIEVLTVPVDWPNNPAFPPPFGAMTDPNVKRINAWHYVGPGHATNNPDGFDLWAEYVEGGELKIISNWGK